MNTKCPNHPSSFILHPSSFRSGFTLVELLVTITIITILAGLSLGALRYARSAAAEAQTKATLAKLNDIVMKQYESYMTRRVPIDASGKSPREAAKLRYLALLDLMRMEMPERSYDIINGPIGAWTGRPALSEMFLQKYTQSPPFDNCRPAKYLYMWISMTSPEVMEQFGHDEIVDLDQDGWPVFVDGWGMPIMFLRWAPGFLPPNSEIQTGDLINDHDPFDTRRIFADNYRLIPLIYSGGPDQAGHEKKYGIIIGGLNQQKYYGVDPITDPLDNLDPYEKIQTSSGDKLIGTPEDGTSDHLDNIHNHQIEQQ